LTIELHVDNGADDLADAGLSADLAAAVLVVLAVLLSAAAFLAAASFFAAAGFCRGSCLHVSYPLSRVP
jgi:hypothetical protein